MVKHESVIKEYLNTPVIIAYIIFFVATFLSIYSYKVVPLLMGAILEATGYIWVTIFGVTIYKEKLNGMKLATLGLIIARIVVYSEWG